MYLNWFAVVDHVSWAFLSFYGIIIPWLVVNFGVRSLDLEITSGRPFCFSCLLPGKIDSKQPETTLHLQRAFFILSFISYYHTSLTLLQGQNLVTSPFIIKNHDAFDKILVLLWETIAHFFYCFLTVERIINCYLVSCRWKNSL